MRYCKKCLNPDTRPNFSLDQDGLCPVCRFADANANQQVDWQARRKELEAIAQWGRENSRCGYDCIVPISGGKDSHRQACFARDELGLKPLLVCSMYSPEHMNELGARNLSNLISLGFDTITFGLNPHIWKQLMRQSFFKKGNWCVSTEMALYAIPIHVAIAYKIPLVFLGENPYYTTGEKASGTGGEATGMQYCNTLGGGKPKSMFEGVTANDLYFYQYPLDKDIERANIRVVYIGYYIEDFSRKQNAKFAIANGLEIRNDPPEKIGDLWGISSLDEDFRFLNQMLKCVKFGFACVTEQVCEMINAGELTREQGAELIKLYDGKCDHSYIERFCRYLDITEEQFWEVVERFRNHEVWQKDEEGQWKLKHEIG